MRLSLLGDKHDPRQPEELQKVFAQACAGAPELDTINLSIIPWSSDLGILRGNPNLRSITIQSPLTVDKFEPLTHLTQLEHLSVCIQLNRAQPTVEPPPLCFASLRSLQAQAWTFNCMRVLLDCAQAPLLFSLRLQFCGLDYEGLLPQANHCMDTVSTKFSGLEALSVECLPAPNRPVFPRARVYFGADAPLATLTAPLLRMHDLRSFTLLFSDFVFSISSATIEAFAHAWPNAEEIHIDTSTDDGRRAGFESIVHFALHCPRLRSLRLPTMELSVDALESVEYPEQPHPLRDLEIAEVVFPRGADLSREMSAFIERMFPGAAIPFVDHPIVVTDEESGDQSRLV